MPKAKHLRFCPQCGCSAYESIGATEVTFTCGERISKSDALTTAYTCGSLAGRYGEVEEALDAAILALTRMGYPAVLRNWIRLASHSPHEARLAPTQAGMPETLLDYGFVTSEENEGKKLLRLTLLGRRIAAAMHP